MYHDKLDQMRLNRGGVIGAALCALIGAGIGYAITPPEWAGKSEWAGPLAFGVVGGIIVGAFVGNNLWTHYTGKP